jgi:hypothetical protein
MARIRLRWSFPPQLQKSYCHAQKAHPFHFKTGKAEFREGLGVKIRRKSSGLPQGNQGIHRVVAGLERLTRTTSKASERERSATV